MQHIVISATGHSINYLPQYVAEAEGFFAEVDLDVTSVVPRPWDKVLDDIASGEAQAALGGIWVPAMHHGRGTPLVPFAQVSGRAPLALIGREPADDFEMSRLVGKVVAMKGSNGASVGIYLKMLLREAGIDPRQVNYIQDLDAGILSRCFAGGMADFLLVDLPGALALEAQGIGHVVTKFAASGGPIPWSVYYGHGAHVEFSGDLWTRFVTALNRGMSWLNANAAESFRPFLSRTFPAIDPDIAVGIVELYRANGMWTTPRISEAAYDRWLQGITDAHLVATPIPYETLIDGRPTETLGKDGNQ